MGILKWSNVEAFLGKYVPKVAPKVVRSAVHAQYACCARIPPKSGVNGQRGGSRNCS